MLKIRIILVVLLSFCCLLSPLSVVAKSHHKHHHAKFHHAKHHHSSLKRKAAWAGAGLAVGRVAGPGGSLAFGGFRHRRELKAGGHTRNKALVKVGAPVAAGVAFGPVGVAGYQGVAHRRWLKHHLLPHQHHSQHHDKKH